jgi:Tol biopolymer transport system component
MIREVLRSSTRLLALGAAAFIALLLGASTASAEHYVYERDDSAEGNLYVGEDGQSPRRIPLFVDSPSLAPDGRRIVYFGNGEHPDILMTDINGHGPHKILPWPEDNIYSEYEWAPDGSELIVSNGDILSLHPSIDGWEWETGTIVGWSGEQVEPTVSPDGSKIAFFSYTKTNGESLGAAGPALFIANRNGSNVEQLTFGAHIGLDPTFSPDGLKIAFMGFDGNDSFSEIYSLNVSTKAVTALTNNSVNDTCPDWRSDNRIGYCSSDFRVMDANGENNESIQSFSGSAFVGAPSWPQIQGDLPNLGPETKEEATELLWRYAPKLYYDSMELFPAMSAQPITEIFTEESAEESNRLIREEGGVIAYANPALSEPNLSWSFLKPPAGNYPNGKPVDGGDRLSERTSDEYGAASDILLFEADPEYAERIYGRAKYDDGRWWLQYWLWSYYQSFLEGFGDHEGDWEMIQIGLDESGLPELATYAQHSSGESCSWSDLESSIGYYGNLAPDVFVSWGVHASYTDADALPGIESTDAEFLVPARVEVMKDASDWVEWPGVWGDSASSPDAPSTQGSKWSQPDDFYEEAGSCDAGARPALRAAGADRPPLARLRARRSGAFVDVTYVFPVDARPRPKWIIVAVSEPGGVPVGGNYPVHGNSGHLRIDASFEGNQLVARARTLAPGAQSPVSEVPVR